MAEEIRVVITFAAGEKVDRELFLESLEAAVMDMLYDKDRYWMVVNWNDSVKYTGMGIEDGK